MKRSFSSVYNSNNSHNQPSKFRRLNNNSRHPIQKDIDIIKQEIITIKQEISTIKQEFTKEIGEIKDSIKQIRLFIGLDYKPFDGPTPSYYI